MCGLPGPACSEQVRPRYDRAALKGRRRLRLLRFEPRRRELQVAWVEAALAAEAQVKARHPFLTILT